MRLHGMLLLSAAVLLPRAAVAQALHQNEVCVQGCFQSITGMEFYGTSVLTDGYYVDQCTNLLRIQSIYLCSTQRCSSSEVEAGVKQYNDFCNFEAHITLPSIDLISNYSAEDISRIPVVAAAQVNGSVFLDNVVLPADDLFDISYETVNSWNASLRLHVLYGWALYAYWAIVITIGISYKLVHVELWTRKARQNTDDVEGLQSAPSTLRKLTTVQHCSLWIRKHLILPATFGYSCATPVRGLGKVPPRLQSIAIWAFAVINLILCCVGYSTFAKSMYFLNYRTQIWRMVSDRTGILSFANLPLLWLFSSRNNVLLWITGWHYETFSRFHRWISRIATLQAIIHSIGYSATAFFDGGKEEYTFDWTQNYFLWGVVATILMSLLCINAAHYFRAHFYETFLYLHIIFAVFTLIGCFYHIKIFNGVYIGYLWPCVAIWVVDRALRLGRIVLLNHFSSSKGHVTYDADSDLVDLTVWPSDLLPRPRRGGYYFLYILNGVHGYESHPFTLASWEHGSREQQATVDDEASSATNGIGVQHEESTTEKSASAVHTETHQDETIVACQERRSLRFTFLIRPRNGFTGRLRDQVIKNMSVGDSGETAAMPVNVLLEGPYGGSSMQIEAFDKLLLIVGGSGITLALSYLQEMSESQGQLDPSQKGSLPTIHVIWAVQGYPMASKLLKTTRLLEYARLINGFSMDVFVTRGAHGTQSTDGKTGQDSPSLHVGNAEGAGTEPAISHHNCRPDIVNIVLDHARATAGEKLGVVGCGPPQMADDCRLGVVNALKEGHNNVELVEESFGW